MKIFLFILLSLTSYYTQNPEFTEVVTQNIPTVSSCETRCGPWCTYYVLTIYRDSNRTAYDCAIGRGPINTLKDSIGTITGVKVMGVGSGRLIRVGIKKCVESRVVFQNNGNPLKLVDLIADSYQIWTFY